MEQSLQCNSDKSNVLVFLPLCFLHVCWKCVCLEQGILMFYYFSTMVQDIYIDKKEQLNLCVKNVKGTSCYAWVKCIKFVFSFADCLFLVILSSPP
jgi:hypothetical protein